MRNLMTVGIAILVLLGVANASPPASFAQASSEGVPDTIETRPLRALMVALAQDMDRISTGIWYEDYVMIEQGGRAIATHPKISPAQMKALKKALGNQFQAFVRYDKQVHHTAVELAEAAAEQRMNAVLDHYDTLQRGCVGCHTAFRQRARRILLERDLQWK